MQNTEKNVSEENFTDRNIVLIVGSEGKGLGSSIKKQCDYLVKIPQVGIVSSLNVSVAAGIMLYEIKKTKTQNI